ncbi:MAG: hypothetical protein JXA14_02005, partial [Anaerolineae bacterium]|nr:hypothetical protein [Anaerolineae bacterium]
MDELRIPKGKLREAELIAQRIPAVMRQRGLLPAFDDWLLTADRGMIWLFGVLDLQRIQRLEDYQSAGLLHHLSTDIQGKPIYLSNSDGLRYAILLSPHPELPRHLPFPGVQRGRLSLGQDMAGRCVSVSWPKAGHMLVAGKTGSG